MRDFSGVQLESVMRTVTVRRIVAAPIERVFDRITDAANYRQVPGVFRAEVTPVGSMAASAPFAKSSPTTRQRTPDFEPAVATTVADGETSSRPSGRGSS